MYKFGILSLVLISLIAISSPVNAMWVCRAVNAKGEAFDTVNKVPQIALENAMLTCKNNSGFSWGDTCSLQFCQKDYYPVPPVQNNSIRFKPIEFSWAH